MGSPKIQGGMTQSEFQQMLAKQQENYEALIEKQNQASIESELARQKADEMQYSLEIQKTAAAEAAINDAQKALTDEMAAKEDALSDKEKADLQSNFNMLFSSYVSGTSSTSAFNLAGGVI